MPKQRSRKSGGTRKYGRNKEKCLRYFTEHRREDSKVNHWLKSCTSKKWGDSKLAKMLDDFTQLQQSIRDRKTIKSS